MLEELLKRDETAVDINLRQGSQSSVTTPYPFIEYVRLLFYDGRVKYNSLFRDFYRHTDYSTHIYWLDIIYASSSWSKLIIYLR